MSRCSILFLLFALLVACGPVRRPDGGSGLIPVGIAAPDVTGRDLEKRDVRLSALRGRPVVVFFYPADGTPGCTKEACAFRDAWKKLEQANVGVIGVSNDSPASHEKFQREKNLPFALAAGLGINSFLAVAVIGDVTWPEAMGLVLVNGLRSGVRREEEPLGLRPRFVPRRSRREDRARLARRRSRGARRRGARGRDEAALSDGRAPGGQGLGQARYGRLKSA